MELFFFRLTLVFPLVFVRVKSLTFFVFLSSALSLLCKKKKKKERKITKCLLCSRGERCQTRAVCHVPSERDVNVGLLDEDLWPLWAFGFRSGRGHMLPGAEWHPALLLRREVRGQLHQYRPPDLPP